MKKARKLWVEKRDKVKGLPRVIVLDGNMSRKWGEGTIVIPAPREVDGFMKQVPKGKLATINLIRSALAIHHSATIACPITTGILVCIAARAAAEEEFCGRTDTTAYWRTVKEKGELNPKYPGGCESQIAHLVAEGHTVVLKGTKFFVKDFEKVLVTF